MPAQVTKRFGDRERDRLIKFFGLLGTDNNESEVARGMIDALLRDYGLTWADLIRLLAGGTAPDIDPDLARNIAALGLHDPGERQNARRNVQELLDRHRKNWNDLTNELCAPSSSSWAAQQAAWPPRVNPADLIYVLLERYVGLKPHEYVAATLWALHTHVYDQFMVTPRLTLRSPVPDCGKTTLLDILATLAAHPDKSDAITTAALYRLIDQTHPTLLIDEADNLGLALRQNGRLRAVFNSGHRKGRMVTIMDRGQLRKYSTFAPLALALPDTFGGLPRTLNSRSITINLERARRELQRFDADHHPDWDAAYVQILLWRREAKLDLDPPMPSELRNRMADNWRPLISIADSLGWGEQAREAALAFAREFADADAKILLLRDIRSVFDARGLERLPSRTIIAALNAMDDADWSEWRGIRGEQAPHKLRQGEMAGMLRAFGIRSRTMWPLNRTAGTKSAKGYFRAQFEDAWRRYCADDDGTASQPNNIRSLRTARGAGE
jgi:hypothetical protein